MFNRLFNKYKFMSLPAKASLWFVFTSVMTKGISFITTPLFTRILTTEEYGIISIYGTWATIISIFCTLELSSGVFNKAMIIYENNREEYISSILSLSSLITLLVFSVYLLGAHFWNSLIGLSTPLMLSMFIDIFFTSAWSLFSAKNRFEYKYKTIVCLTIVTCLLSTLISFILVISFPENHVEAKIYGAIIGRIFFYLYIFVFLIRKGGKIYKSEYWNYSIKYNLPLIPHYLSQFVLNQSDRVMISKMSGNAEAGIYSLAYQVAIIMQIVINAIASSFMPWTFQNLKQGNYKILGKRALQIEIFVGILCCVFSLFAPEVIYILGGTNYLPAMYIVPPVSMSVLLLIVYSFFGNVEFYFEKTKIITSLSCIIAITNIGLNYVFIKIFGYIAAGYTTLICYLLYAIVHYVLMKKICKEKEIPNPYPEKKIWGVAILFVLISVCISFIYEYREIRYISIIVLSVITVLYFYRNKESILGK